MKCFKKWLCNNQIKDRLHKPWATQRMSNGLSLVAAEQWLAPLDHEDCLPRHIWMAQTVAPQQLYLLIKLNTQIRIIGIIALNIFPKLFI